MRKTNDYSIVIISVSWRGKYPKLDRVKCQIDFYYKSDFKEIRKLDVWNWRSDYPWCPCGNYIIVAVGKLCLLLLKFSFNPHNWF